jgi:hypothetical protein
MSKSFVFLRCAFGCCQFSCCDKILTSTLRINIQNYETLKINNIVLLVSVSILSVLLIFLIVLFFLLCVLVFICDKKQLIFLYNFKNLI